MASRPRSRLVAVLGAVALATGACSQVSGPGITSGLGSTTSVVETASPPPSTTTPAPTTGSTVEVPGIDAEVLIPEGKAGRQTVEDLVCAVRFAAAHPSSDGTVAIVGFSAGAHLSALVALTGNRYGQDCPFPGTGVPDRLVGLAGPYDAERLGGATSTLWIVDGASHTDMSLPAVVGDLIVEWLKG